MDIELKIECGSEMDIDFVNWRVGLGMDIYLKFDILFRNGHRIENGIFGLEVVWYLVPRRRFEQRGSLATSAGS